jgi:hypothetical protein
MVTRSTTVTLTLSNFNLGTLYSVEIDTGVEEYKHLKVTFM